MPRLDNSSELAATYFPRFCHPTDPDKRVVIDLCRNCFRPALWNDIECDHPPYGTAIDPKFCVKCKVKLTLDDD